MRLSFIAIILFISFSNVYASSAIIDDRPTNQPLTISKRKFTLGFLRVPQITPDYRRFFPQMPNDPGIERRFEKGKPRSPGAVDGEFNGLPVVIEHSYSGKGREFNSKLKKLEQEQQLVAWQLLLRTSDGYLVKLPPRDQQENENSSSNPPRQDTFIYRKAFTEEEEQEIQNQFKAGKKRKGKLGPKVVTEFHGLPVVINHFEKEFEDSKEKWDYFTSTLKNYEQEHKLVRWTSTYYIVQFRKW